MFRIHFSSPLKHREDFYIETDCETLEEAEDVALCECRLFEADEYIMLLHRGVMLYDIRAGMRLIGNVFIRSL